MKTFLSREDREEQAAQHLADVKERRTRRAVSLCMGQYGTIAAALEQANRENYHRDQAAVPTRDEVIAEAKRQGLCLVQYGQGRIERFTTEKYLSFYAENSFSPYRRGTL